MIKSIMLCITCCTLLTVSKAQTITVTRPTASIDLIIKNSPRQMFILLSSNQSAGYDIIDSLILGEKDGTDSLHFEIPIEGEESHLSLVFRQKKFRRFVPVLAPREHLKVIEDFNKPNDIAFSGSAHTREYYDFLKQDERIMGEYPAGDRAKYIIALKAGSADSVMLKHKIDSINNLDGIFLRKTIINTQCAYVAVFALMFSQNGIVTYTKKELSQLKEKFKDDKPALMQIGINENLQEHPFLNKPKPANGTYLAAFTLPDINGKPVSLDQFKGKYVLVDFWASWCSPCRKQSPYLKQALQQFGKNNFVILSISTDENPDDWKKAIVQDGTQNFVQLIDVRGMKSPVTKQYNIESIPSNFLLDPAGKVIDKDLKGEKLIARVAEAIKNTDAKN